MHISTREDGSAGADRIGDVMAIDYYYCGKCDKYVLPIRGRFIHPHMGESSCKICAMCHNMVYLKKVRGKEAT